MDITIRDDFDLTKIAESGQCFRWRQMPDGGYRVIHGDRCLYIRRTGEARYLLDCDEAAFEAVWRDYFDLGEDYRAIRSRIDPAGDPFLFEASEQEKGIRILRQSPWEALVSFIISQNRNIPAICASIERLCALAGERHTDSRGGAFFAFPSPEALAALTEEELKACRMGYRCKYVHAAAEAVRSGQVDLQALAEEDCGDAVHALTAMYGVGVKVASCAALFGLHHLDAFPVDVWIRRVLERESPNGYPRERYSPYNGVFQQYMFAYYRNGGKTRGKAEPADDAGM